MSGEEMSAIENAYVRNQLPPLQAVRGGADIAQPPTVLERLHNLEVENQHLRDNFESFAKSTCQEIDALKRLLHG